MRPRPPPSKAIPRPQRTIKLSDKKPSSEAKSKQDALKNDIALLMKSIDTNLSSIDQVLKVFRIATPEILELLTNECSLIFECKICKNLFRSIANFMTHKRGYCLGKFEELFQNHEHCDHSWYAKCRKSKTLSSRSTTRKDILTILESMKHMTKEHTASEDVILKDIPTTNEGLFNLRYESQEPKEKEKILTVEPVDVETSVNSEPIDSSKCNFCSKEFTSHKALSMHTKADHGDLRMCFVCPCCKKYFANTWSVYRHMYKVHRKTSEQVRKLRTQIQKKQVTLEELNRSKKSNMTSPVEERVDQDKAFMEELRGHASLQMCSGCGKKFERKVALLSHATHCQKKKIIPPEVVHTLKRKSLTPMRAVEEKKIKMDDADLDEMIIRMKSLDARVVLKKTNFPIGMGSKSSVSLINDSSKEDDSLSTEEEDVKDLVQRYQGECVYGENTFEDLLNKLHMEVPLGEYSDNDSSDHESRNKNYSHKANDSDSSDNDESRNKNYSDKANDSDSSDNDESRNKNYSDKANDSDSSDNDESRNKSYPHKANDSDNDSDHESRNKNYSHKANDSSDSSDYASKMKNNIPATINGNDTDQSDSESDGYESEDGGAIYISSGDDEEDDNDEDDKISRIYKMDRSKIKVEREDIADEESNTEYTEEYEIDGNDEQTNIFGQNQELKEKTEEKVELLNKNLTEEDQQESVNEECSVINESNNDEFSEDENSFVYEDGEREELVEGETEIEDEEEADNSSVAEIEGSALEAENEGDEIEDGEEVMEGEDEEDINVSEIGDKDSQTEARIMEIETTNLNEIDGKDYSFDYTSGPESSKEGESSKDYLSLETDKEAICDNGSGDSISDINMKESLFAESSNKTLEVIDGESLMIEDAMDNYDVAKEIVLFNDCEEVCISTLSDSEQPLEDSLSSIQISTDKHNPLVNGDSHSLCPQSPQSVDNDEDGDLISEEKGDWVAKKINSFMSCQKKKCLLCLKTFHRVNFVRRHVALHFNINKFKCLVNSCNFQSYLRSDMSSHLIKVHKKKEFEPFVRRLYPKKEDFDACEYNPDPKPLYAFEKHYRTNNEECGKKTDVTLRISEKEDNISSAMIIDGSDLDIIGETEVATVESIITPQSVLQCASDLEDSGLKDALPSSSSEEKLQALMMEVIFGSKIAEPSESVS